MDALSLARIQFFMTIGFHFIFPPLSIGLAWFIVWLMTKYMRTKDLFYKNLSWFWIKVFALTVAIGIPTGIFMEFQFGTNWSEFSRFVGAIFAAPLALEIFFAFFLESVFLGVMLQGWRTERVSDKILWLSSIIFAIGATLSAFWILVANSWMQTPRGYDIVEDKLVLTDLWASIFTPSMWPRFWHTFNACLITSAFFVIGISAFYILKNKHLDYAKYCLKFALIVGVVVSLLQVILGHWQSVTVALYQPAKFAAQEGHFVTEKGAPLIIFAILDDSGVYFKLGIPYLLSFLTHGDPNASVTGLNDFLPENRPPVLLTFYPFHAMVLFGGFFILYALIGIFLIWKKKLFDQNWALKKWYLRVGVLALPLPTLANELGWMAAEVGRQPWIVQDVLKTTNAVSVVVPPEQILFSIILFCCTFILLFLIWVLALVHIVRKGPEPVEERT